MLTVWVAISRSRHKRMQHVRQRKRRRLQSVVTVVIVSIRTTTAHNTSTAPHIYRFTADELDNEDVILAVENTPTYKRTKQMIKDISASVILSKIMKKTKATRRS